MRRYGWLDGILAVLLACMPVTFARAASIGLFADPDCSTCRMTLAAGEIGTFYIAAQPLELQPSRPDGAEFRVVGLPDGWHTVSVQPSPAAAIVIGDPLGGGTNIAFPTGQPGPCVNLFTVQVFASNAASEVQLRVVQHSTPSNPLFQCPVMVMDWIPFTKICVDGGSLLVNSVQNCSVSVTSTTWSMLRRLYD